MAKNPKTKSATARRPRSSGRAGASKRQSSPKAAKRRSKQQRAKGEARSRQSGESAADALVGLLETPLVNDVLAAGVAAALATFTHHSLTRKKDDSTATTLKEAAKAAGTAMGARLATEFDEIVKGANDGPKRAKG